MTKIQTARLLLRPWQPGDLAEFTRLLTNPEVTRYIVVHTPFSPQDVAELSERTLDQWQRNGFGPWAAIEKATGRWVGRIGLNELPDWPGPHRIEVGWELHPEFWGRGLATEGGQAGVRHGDEQIQTELQELVAGLLPEWETTNVEFKRQLDTTLHGNCHSGVTSGMTCPPLRLAPCRRGG